MNKSLSVLLIAAITGIDTIDAKRVKLDYTVVDVPEKAA